MRLFGVFLNHVRVYVTSLPACPSDNINRTLYLRRLMLETILAAALALPSNSEATRMPRMGLPSSSTATSPM